MHQVFDIVGALKEALLRTVPSRDYVLLDWPNHANTGDHLIWLGEKFMLHALKRKCVLESNIDDYRQEDIDGLPKDTTILLHGGGNFGDLYPEYQSFRERVIAENPDRRIVCMPQTIHFEKKSDMTRSFERLQRHSNLFLLVRDVTSLGLAQQNMCSSRVLLAPDSAFSLWPIVQALVYMLSPSQSREDVWIMRGDGERLVRSAWPIPLEARVGDWTDEPFDWSPLSENELGILRRLGADEYFCTDKDHLSFRRMLHGISLLASGNHIWTDRLHAHVLSLMMGREHHLFDNNYGKNRGFVECWTERSPLLSFVP